MPCSDETQCDCVDIFIFNVCRWGDCLVMVASQEVREKAILGLDCDPNVPLSDIQYCLLEHIGQAKGLKDEELEVIYELLSNMSGALEVQKLIKGGVGQKEALNTFMQRVMGSIDK